MNADSYNGLDFDCSWRKLPATYLLGGFVFYATKYRQLAENVA